MRASHAPHCSETSGSVSAFASAWFVTFRVSEGSRPTALDVPRACGRTWSRVILLAVVKQVSSATAMA